METYNSFDDLKRRGIVNNRTQLARLIRDHGFPVGILIGPNSRRWPESSLKPWLDARPAAVERARGRQKPAAAAA